ncbi:hypothetical protein [Ferruginibacter sp. SUN106]|uniref:hypothetical protein n=1 Tax=Ferruginibacter sp. SUN106 TaxID=2978348 RepID=UPI003D36D135
MDATPVDIATKFSDSWIETVQFYNGLIDDDPGFDRLIPLTIFIHQLKRKGADKFFRLGNSMQDLIFSRSIEPGLRPEQKFVAVQAIRNSFVVSLREGKKLHKEYTIKDLEDDRLTDLLQVLKDTEIN